jgi:hypothetical protein
MKNHLTTLLTVSVCFISIFIIAAIVASFPFHVLPIDPDEILKTYAVPPDMFAPEPQERLIYVINTLLTPFICIGVYVLISNQIKKENTKKLKLLSWIISPTILYLLFYLAYLGLDFAPFKYIKPTGLVQHPWITFLLNAVLLTVWLGTYHNKIIINNRINFKRLADIFYWGAGCTILILIGLEAVFNEAEAYVPHIHFIAYFDSVVQVFLGRQLYTYAVPQYGFYAWFLNPIFQLIGLSVLKFTVVMGILRIIVYGSFLYLFHRILDSKLVAFLCFATVFFFTRMRVPIDILKDPYFQYNPHRMIFPVVLVLFTWLYLNAKDARKKRWFYIINGILAPISILWNLDTGVVAAFAWVGFLTYQELLDFKKTKLLKTISRLFQHALVIAISFSLVFGAFTASVYFASGQLPHFTLSDEYVRLFYGLGFFMMPMMIVHPWNMVVLTYVIGIFYSMRGLVVSYQQQEPGDQQINKTNSFLFITSLIGVGLFNYYIGRSHEYNLVASIWPAYILLAIYIQKLIQYVRPLLRSRSVPWQKKLLVSARSSFQVILLFALLYFLGSVPVSIFTNLPAYSEVIQTRITRITQGLPPMLAEDIKIIEETSTNSDIVFIISDYAPELYLYTQHTNPLDIAGFGEIILRTDVDTINEFLKAPPPNAKIYWDNGFYDVNPYPYDINPSQYLTPSRHEFTLSKNLVLLEEVK